MKVQKTTTQETFQPIELKITIETEKEFLAVLNMTAGYYSVPATLVKEGEIYEENRDTLEEFLKNISSALQSECH